MERDDNRVRKRFSIEPDQTDAAAGSGFYSVDSAGTAVPRW
jgi:hypothetical protein